MGARIYSSVTTDLTTPCWLQNIHRKLHDHILDAICAPYKMFVGFLWDQKTDRNGFSTKWYLRNTWPQIWCTGSVSSYKNTRVLPSCSWNFIVDAIVVIWHEMLWNSHAMVSYDIIWHEMQWDDTTYHKNTWSTINSTFMGIANLSVTPSA